MTRAERARDLFFEGCNCAQAVFLAFAEDRMDRDTALKIASGYGGGMAGMRGVCGAVNGMFMAYGLLRGSADPNDRAAKTAAYQTLRQLAGEFEAQNGSLICRQLLGLDPDFKPQPPGDGLLRGIDPRNLSGTEPGITQSAARHNRAACFLCFTPSGRGWPSRWGCCVRADCRSRWCPHRGRAAAARL